MGSGSSKASSSSGRRDRSKGKARVFQPSCLGSLSRSRRDSDNADQVYEPCDKDDDYTQCANQNDTESENSRTATGKKGEVDLLSETAFVSSNAELQERDVSSMPGTVPRDGSSSIQASVTQPLNPSGRFFSRFSFDPCNVSFRLGRATSLGSSRDYHVTPTNMTRLEDEENLHFHGAPSSGLFNVTDSQQSSCLLDSSLVNGGPPAQFDENNFGSRWSNSLLSEPPDNLGANLTISSTQNVGRDINNARAAIDMNLRTPRLFTEPGYVEPGQSERRAGVREPVERNVRFSRTLSVGRLRDRVLRRSSLSELTYCPVQRDTEASDEGQGSERQGGETGASATVSNAGRVAPISGYSATGLSRSLFSIQDNDGDSSRSRDARYRDLLEHRSDFLERRRRIRSQVRALQRLESRFENLSGHERSCILSGQHRSGRCTCRNWNRDPNSNDETTARASISRIVMLAEALFEVLDEIHQQSVVLSSQPSVSSIGSVPAPNEVVDSLPTKVYRKLQTQKNEEAAQCYICLVEYEDGEIVRMLPCHHEFHRTCIDKWLKEIHRVCPLCRGDICRSDSFSADNED